MGTSDGSSSNPFYSLTDFQTNFNDVFDNTDALNDFLLQYADMSNVTYELSVYYSNITIDNQNLLFFEIPNKDYLINNVVNISDLIRLKQFLN